MTCGDASTRRQREGGSRVSRPLSKRGTQTGRRALASPQSHPACTSADPGHACRVRRAWPAAGAPRVPDARAPGGRDRNRRGPAISRCTPRRRASAASWRANVLLPLPCRPERPTSAGAGRASSASSGRGQRGHVVAGLRASILAHDDDDLPTPNPKALYQQALATFRRSARRSPRSRRPRTDRDDRGDSPRASGSPRASCCSRRRRARLRLLHQLRQPQGRAARRAIRRPRCCSSGRRCATGAGARRGPRRTGVRGAKPTRISPAARAAARSAPGPRCSRRRWRSREAFEARIAAFEQRYADGADVPRPPHWAGFRVVPDLIEFWYGAQFRLHERHVYERDASGWCDEADAEPQSDRSARCDSAALIRCVRGPRRIVCLTEEPTEVLYALGEQDAHRRHLRLHRAAAAGAQGKAEGQRVHQREDRRDPRAASRISSIGFSDIQADIARRADPARRRGLDQQPPQRRRHPRLHPPARRAGRRVGERAEALCATSCSAASTRSPRAAATLPRRPQVYFEEWDEPLISGIRWVAELVRIAGGDDIFPERAAKSLAKRPHPRRRRTR